MNDNGAFLDVFLQICDVQPRSITWVLLMETNYRVVTFGEVDKEPAFWKVLGQFCRYSFCPYPAKYTRRFEVWVFLIPPRFIGKTCAMGKTIQHMGVVQCALGFRTVMPMV